MEIGQRLLLRLKRVETPPSGPPPASTARPRSHPQGPRSPPIEPEREIGYSSLDAMKMIYLKLIQCFFSITNPLTESGHTPTGRILSPSTEWLILDDAIPEIKFEKSTEF